MRDEKLNPAFDLGIIGGGAAGLFAACFAKKRGISFKLFEKTLSFGNKLLLTGGGRCNILNLKIPGELKSCYHDKGNFIYPSLAGFSASDAYVFIEKELGVKLTEEENNRIFPASFKSRDILDALISYIGEENMISGFDVSSIDCLSDGTLEIKTRSGERVTCRNVLLAAGGMSYPQTGSAGDSYRMAVSLGHSLTETRAALAPVKIEDRGKIKVPAGLTIKDVAARIFEGCKIMRETRGDLLFTHEGLSGPAVMELARDLKKGSVIRIDLAPGLTDEILRSAMEEHPSKKFVNVLSGFIPLSLAEYIVSIPGADPGMSCAKVTKDIRKECLALIKEFKVTLASGPDIKIAYVTAGGVDTAEVNRKTMESRLVKGLFFAGEVLDCDGISGGYNLTACIAQAKLAVDSLRI